jgi:hypothetical protein
VAAAIAVTMTGCAPQQYVEIRDLVTGDNAEGLDITNPRDETDTLCADVGGCVSGWISDEGTIFLKFDSSDHAAEYADDLGSEVFRTNPLVIDFRQSSVSDEQQEWIAERFAAAHQS